MAAARSTGSGHPSRRNLAVLTIAACLAALAFVSLTAMVWRANAAVGLDRFAEQYGGGPGKRGLLGNHAQLAVWAESIGSPMHVALGASAIVALAALWRDWVMAVVALLAPLGSFALTEFVAKPIINQPIPFGGRSYPSGHGAGVAAVVAAALIIVYGRWGGAAAALLAPFALTIVTAVGLGVLALDFHHYATDVVGGALLGATLALALTVMLTEAGRGVAYVRSRSGRR